MNNDIVSYYKDRAREYEEIYAKPERQDDLESAALIIQDRFRGQSIFEIACGTGYWTQQLAKTAGPILATDINESVIEIARHKDYGKTSVVFKVADFLNHEESKKSEALFGGFIWSHIPVEDLEQFLTKINQFVHPGGLVVFMDNNYVAGSNLPITKTDEMGNTFQSRKLKDGSEHIVRKNFPSEAFVRKQLQNCASEAEWISLQYFWILIYRTGF